MQNRNLRKDFRKHARSWLSSHFKNYTLWNHIHTISDKDSIPLSFASPVLYILLTQLPKFGKQYLQIWNYWAILLMSNVINSNTLSHFLMFFLSLFILLRSEICLKIGPLFQVLVYMREESEIKMWMEREKCRVQKHSIFKLAPSLTVTSKKGKNYYMCAVSDFSHYIRTFKRGSMFTHISDLTSTKNEKAHREMG